MPASPADSALYRGLFSDDEVHRLFSDSAEIRSMLLVEGALARVQGEAGIIPKDAAAFIDRASREVQIDPAGLADATATNGVVVPALLAAFRKAAEAPDMMQYVHWGATSQDIMDTGLMLRMKRLLELFANRLDAILDHLCELADASADIPMAGRTYGQVATPTTFGAVVAAWGRPLLRWRDQISGLRDECLCVSLSGAAGTSAAMGPMAPDIRARLAQELGLVDPCASWHSERDRILRLCDWMAGVTGALGKMGEDLILLAQSGQGEIVISGAGASSTMPQKQNPVGPSVLVALARQTSAHAGLIHDAALHRQQRDGSAWFTEWLTVPQICCSTGKALALSSELVQRTSPDPDAMLRGLDPDGLGLIHAEGLSFALAARMPRDAAQARIKTLCGEARDTGIPLQDLVARDHEGLTSAETLGQAPIEARDFAARVRRRRLG